LIQSEKISYTGQESCDANRNETWTVGLIYCNGFIQSGYTLFSPMGSETSYLIDQYGREVHSWTSPNGYPGLLGYLLEDGDLLKPINLGNGQPGEFAAGGSMGGFERISWDGELEWFWTYSSETYRSHHDIEPLPNGNFLIIAWEYRNATEAEEKGKILRSESSKAVGNSSVWPDKVLEIKPVGSDDAEIVWEWSFWDHTIQDIDDTKDNFGNISDHPELLNINHGYDGQDWLHCNGIDYNHLLDQIALSCKNTNEIYIIDHSTTTEEASGNTGGNSGMGGDILYRYGNPESYGRGNSSNQSLFGQHDARWIEDGYPDAGKLMIFNNGNGRNLSYSSVDVISLPINGSKYFIENNQSFGPTNLSWTWDIGTDMYSPIISGSTRLANGNTLITFGVEGTLIEVDYSGNIVWKYINPVNMSGMAMNQGDSLYEQNNRNYVFKVERYDGNHPALKGRDLVPIDYIENWNDQCPEQNSLPYDVDGDGCIDDSDNDGFNDFVDICPGYNDSIDEDLDAIPDGCDLIIDNDNDGISNNEDLCDGFNDSIDIDNDSIPDACDSLIDRDGDGVDDEFDWFPDDPTEAYDSDLDGVGDTSDQCEGFDDRIDVDNDQIVDGCDETIGIDEKEVIDNENINADSNYQIPAISLITLVIIALFARKKYSG
tara:strand:+ start:175 stop:2148 length:1974 start_codon:yes stop_codon:yes gene_type:complete